MKINLLILISTILFSFAVHAEVPFNGLILDAFGKPVKGVRVYTTNAHRYATSDKQGRFGLTDVAPTDTLTLKIKKETVRIPVEGRKSMRIQLAEEFGFKAEQDEELVNYGYGYVKKREYTGVSNGISGDRLRKTGQRSVLQALVGLVPGLEIKNGSVTIRGERSFLMSSEPIYLVDGVKVSSLDYISVYDVDHVEVLKDASIYGSQGANGAILVTTISATSRRSN